MIEIEIKVETLVWSSTQNDFKIYGCLPTNEEDIKKFDLKFNQYSNLSLNGVMPKLDIGSVYNVKMVEKKHPKYGIGYEVQHVFQNIPQSVDEQKAYFSTILTDLQVQSIYEAYGENVDIIQLMRDNTFNFTKVKGMGEYTYNIVRTKIISNLELQEALVALSEYGLTYSIVSKLVKRYGSAKLVVEKIKKNPYTLTEVDGIGFTKCDTYALKMGIEPTSTYRIEACVNYVLNEESESSGHAWLSKEGLIKKCVEMMEIDKSCVKDYIDNYNGKQLFISEDKVAKMNLYNYEKGIYESVKRLLFAKPKPIENLEEKIDKAEEKQGFKFTDEQRDAIKLACENNLVVITGKAGTGKAQPLSSLILTENGYKKMGDIKIGDKVFGEDGNTHNVTGVFPQGEKDIYKVEFQDGSFTHSCKEHLWTVKKQYKYKTIQLQEIMNDSLYTWKSDKKNKNGKSKSWKYQIPVTKPLNFNKVDIPLDPYLLGFLIGEGELNDKYTKLSINPNEMDLIEKIYKRINECGFSIKLNDRCTHSIIGKANGKYLHNILSEMKLNVKSDNKFIPEIYKINSIDVRLNILKGLIDSDGTIDGSAVMFSTCSKTLAEDVKFLVHSLGGIATISKKENVFYKDKNGDKVFCKDSYTLYIKINEKIFTSLKHEERAKKVNKRTSVFRSIRNIEYVGKEECQCIMVDNENHLYLTDDMIVTHNTTILKGVIAVLRENNDFKDYYTCALSGKASQRIAESTGLESSTIHRLLGWNNETGRFMHDINNKLPKGVGVIDEASMVNSYIFYSLITAIPTDGKFIIIGDGEQLEAIGASAVFKDLVESNAVPVAYLTQVHRQALKSGILSTANRIREGVQFNEKDNFDDRVIGELKDLHFKPYRQAESVKKAIIKASKQYLKAPNFDLMNFQVIVPLKSRGEICTKKLNLELQEIFNPEMKPIIERNGYQFKEGDKIIQCGNNYDVNVFNGTLGIITNVDTINKEVIIDFFGVGSVKYSQEEMGQIDMAYVLTVHKVQGSQFDNVIIGIDYSSYILLSRQLIYTALTRASKLAILICENDALIHAIRTNKLSKRNTFLKEFLVTVDK